MAVLGKRKAQDAPSVSEDDAAAIFRRHFESQFLPLVNTKPNAAKAAAPVNEVEDEQSHDDEDADEGSNEGVGDAEEWGGLSEDEPEVDEAPTIEVVDHSNAQISKTTIMSKRERKAFMSSRAPEQISSTAETTAKITSSTSPGLPEDAPSLLAQDLELRRLLAESHLLAPTLTAAGNHVTPKAFAAGRTRHKATDLRVQALGSKMSIHKQEKMPMNMRKGIVAAAGAREAKRRKEAKENGIILERDTGKKSKQRRKGDQGVDRPGVGRLKGAELKLSDRDVRKIESGRDTFGRRGR